jgi:hypothetical protein
VFERGDRRWGERERERDRDTVLSPNKPVAENQLEEK